MNVQNILMDLASIKPAAENKVKSKLSTRVKDFAHIFDCVVAQNTKSSEGRDDSINNKFVDSVANKNDKQFTVDNEKNSKVEGRTFAVVKKVQISKQSEIEQKCNNGKDEVVSELAGIMGIQPTMLQDILIQLDISLDDLTKNSDINVVAEKMAEGLKLTKHEKSALSEIMQNILGQKHERVLEGEAMNVQDALILTEASPKSIESVNEFEYEMQSQLQTVEKTVNDNSVNTTQSVNMTSKTPMEFELEIVNDSSMENSDDILCGIREKSLLYIANNKLCEESTQDVIRSNMQQHLGAYENEGEQRPDSDSEQDLSFNASLQNIGASVHKPEVFENYVVVQKTQDVKQSVITKNELLNQVIDKARVLLSPDKAEMVVDLKPDSLGKLSLKIITERDTVMAKFTAESQQVKEILESNMDFLKDSLEKQGFNVQGFSVSVGKDSSQDTTDKQNRVATAFKEKHRSYSIPEIEQQTSGLERLAGYYQWSTSSIDYIA